MRYQPLANRVIVREVEEDKRTNGGLWVPDIARRNKSIAFGEVIAVGPGRLNADGKLVPVHVAVGDLVIFPRQAPAVLPLMSESGEEEEVLMLPENDVIAKVYDLPRATGLIDVAGAPLSLAPQSTALADAVYENREGIERTVSDLEQINAPPDVIEEIASEQVDHVEAE